MGKGTREDLQTGRFDVLQAIRVDLGGDEGLDTGRERARAQLRRELRRATNRCNNPL